MQDNVCVRFRKTILLWRTKKLKSENWALNRKIAGHMKHKERQR